MNGASAGLVMAATMLMSACAERPLYVVVTVDDSPDGLVDGAVSLHYGSRLDALERLVLNGRALPVTFGLKARESEVRSVWVEARAVDGIVLGRGHATVSFSRGSTKTTVVTLKRPCAGDDDCQNGRFCDGRERCLDAACEPAAATACGSSFACVVASCDEDADACVVSRDDDVCETGTVCSDKVGCVACDILSVTEGCPRGRWCAGDGASSEYVRGECYACDTADHCGDTCQPCAPSSWCEAGTTCRACDTEAHCGPTCVACDPDGPTPVCGGEEAGCVVASCVGQPDYTRCRVASPRYEFNVCMSGTCVEPGCNDASCNTPMYAPLGETDQSRCFDALGAPMACPGAPCNADGTPACCGQDADYDWSITERFVRSEAVATEPVVLDALSGAMWQGCVAGQRGSACELFGAVSFTRGAAFAYCDDLEWGGVRDWRLPNRFELQSLVELDDLLRATDVEAFPETPSGVFMSASLAAWDSNSAWGLGSLGGTVEGVHLPSTPYSFVRCVRGSPPTRAADARFFKVAASEPTVTDTITGLVWQGCARGQTTAACTGTTTKSTWPAALEYCERLTWAGHSEWRLPDIKELSGLVNDHVHAPAIDGAAFPMTPSDLFWSSTSLYGNGASSPVYALGVNFHFGGIEPWHKATASYSTRCVRNSP